MLMKSGTFRVLCCGWMLLGVEALAQASWDDPVSPARSAGGASVAPPRSRETGTPPPVRQDDAVRLSRRGAQVPGHLYSVLLDTPINPLYRYRLGFVTSAAFDERASALYEFDGEHELAFFRNVLFGDLDFGFYLHTTAFTRSISDRFPRNLNRLAFDAGLTWRYLNGRSLELRAFPGLYGALDATLGDMVAVPLRILLHQAIHPDLAGVVGIEFRRGWDRAFMPVGGIAWEPETFFRADILLPRSRLNFLLGRLNLYAGAEWRNWSYAIDKEDEQGAKQLSLNDYVLSLGAGWRFTEELQLGVEAGRLVGRRLDTDAGEDPSLKAESANLFRFALIGPF